MKRLEWYSKNCPKCHGDIFIDSDKEGRFRNCLQCGYLQYEYEMGLTPLPLLRTDLWAWLRSEKERDADGRDKYGLNNAEKSWVSRRQNLALGGRF